MKCEVKEAPNDSPTKAVLVLTAENEWDQVVLQTIHDANFSLRTTWDDLDLRKIRCARVLITNPSPQQ